MVEFDSQMHEISFDDHPGHYCGIFGVYGHPRAAELTFYGLYALQHRGQESAGIVTCHNGQFFKHHGMGLVAQVFAGIDWSTLPGHMAIGHTRYSTTGSSNVRNIQPLTVECKQGQIALAHNGNLTNALELRDQLEEKGLIFQTTTDSEIILMLLAQPTIGGEPNNLLKTIRSLRGAFSLVIMTEKELIGVRDRFGFRPLSIGKKEDAWVLASETCAFDLIGAKFVREVEPGEIVIIDERGLKGIQAFPEHKRRAFCIFEFIYFARPDSCLMGRTVHQVRVELGRQLARENPVDADVVVPVPDSGNCAALGYSLESGIPFEMAFVRNHYVGRSFIQPSQLIRDFNVRVKLNLIAELVRGKRVIVIDDSIVRGTTSRARINTLKEAGAKEVHMMVSCPPHRFPCVYGIDFPDRSKLLAANCTIEQIRQYLNTDSLYYLSQEGMVKATGLPSECFCMACYDGNYPEPFRPDLDKAIIERRPKKTESLAESILRDLDQTRLF